MNYQDTLEYLYERTPAYHQVGDMAYKPGLERSIKLDDFNGNPHYKYKTIHIAGTNGKGSVAHLLAANLQTLGYKVGLYTSPHLVNFKERIRINGYPIAQNYVVDFVKRNIQFIEKEKPSFFELTSIMAFDYFKYKKVDWAIIETGLGGRLDSTNIIKPVLSIITNISLEHTQYLGNTLLDIAAEKAGIIKPKTPVVIGDLVNRQLHQFFQNVAKQNNAPLVLATPNRTLLKSKMCLDGSWQIETKEYGMLHCELRGMAQKNNIQAVLAALQILSDKGLQLRATPIKRAFEYVTRLTGLMGRWQEISSDPKIVCDIGHNVGAWQSILQQLAYESLRHDQMHIVLGVSNDKDIDGMMALMPRNAIYYFTQADTKRAMPVKMLADKGSIHGLKNKSFTSVKSAVYNALLNTKKKDFLFIGGSAFVVAEVLPLFPEAIIHSK